jgi:serine/threonine protein kinase
LKNLFLPDERSSDVYAFGLVFYMIITRQTLFQTENAMYLGYMIATTGLTPEIPSFIPVQLVI